MDDDVWAELEAWLDEARDLNHNRRRWDAAAAVYRRLLDRLAAIEPEGPGDSRDRWDDLAVRAHVGLAWSMQVITNDLEEPMALCDRSDRIASRARGSSLLGLSYGQRGMLLMRSGDPRQAVTWISKALEMLDPDKHRDLVVNHTNRGHALSEIGDFRAASQDYQKALEHAEALGSPEFLSMALGHVGYAAYTLGDLPRALAMMRAGYEVDSADDDGISRLGRAEVLYDSGLLEDAERLLDEAVERLARSRLHAEQAEAEWYHARCLLGMRNYGEAQRIARRAGRRFAGVGYHSMALLARVLELEAQLGEARSAPPSRAVARRRARAVLDVARTGDAAGAYTGLHPGHAARLVAARWLVLAGDVDEASDVFDAAGRDRRHAPLTFRVQRAVVAAELAFARGDRARGLRAVRKGFRLLTEHRSKLGAVESVTSAAVHGVDLQLVDVSAALDAGRPQAFFDALERGRATFAGAGRVTPPDDPRAAELLTEARGLLSRARELPADAEHAAEREDLTSRAGALQEEVRQRAWIHTGDAEVDRPATTRETIRVLRGTAVVANFAVFGGRLRAVRVDGRGARLLDLGDPAEIIERIRRVRADIAVTANEHIPPPLRAAAQASLDRSLKKLDDAVLAPLSADGDLHVVAREPLLGIPWAALPSRQGRRTSVNSHVARGRPDARPGTGHRLLAAAGPGVVHGTGEAGAVGEEWPGATVLTGAAATTAVVREALATHDVVHLAAHGRHDADNPLFASIELADGPLFAHELDGMRLPGSVVVLAACEVGGSSEVVGGEVLGLTSVLLRLGARAVIAAVAPLPDALAAQVMPRFHAHLRATDDPEAALAAACAEAGRPVPLVCFSSLAGL